ncbi:MAG: ATP-binding protein [Candidatus Eremiobacteraeota bacterium]|nr:ATP-binding protein [Candidatus Eremiobacteraeota bacterium]
MKRLFTRQINEILITRLKESRQFIQVLFGPRQVGKTTALMQVLESIAMPSHSVSADQPSLRNALWLEEQWEVARLLARREKEAVLAVDEIQKVPLWPEVVKRLWDEDSRAGTPLKVVLLGSSPLLIQSGLTESLAGRFEAIRAGHWTFSECHEFFGWDLDTFIYFGGYPGAAHLIRDRERWSRYIQDSLIETTLSRDILLMTRVDKPALLRRLFFLGCEYSGQVLSYQKMLGQLHDAGNTTTLAHYLELLSGAGFLAGIGKYSGESVRRRASSPKLLVYDTALITAQSPLTFKEARADRKYWGRLVESAAGAYLLNLAADRKLNLFYWREGDREVDFVLQKGKKLIAMEVKSGAWKGSLSGMASFDKAFHPDRRLLAGADGIPLDELLRWEPFS